MPRKQAHAVGLKARRIAGEIEADLKAHIKKAMRAIAQLEEDDPKREELTEASKDAKAQLLRAEVELAAARRRGCAAAIRRAKVRA